MNKYIINMIKHKNQTIKIFKNRFATNKDKIIKKTMEFIDKLNLAFSTFLKQKKYRKVGNSLILAVKIGMLDFSSRYIVLMGTSPIFNPIDEI